MHMHCSIALQVYLPYVTGCSVVPSKRAVNRICLAIPSGEFFGFVGVNGKFSTDHPTNYMGICVYTINSIEL